MPRIKDRPTLTNFMPDIQPLDLEEFSALTDLLFVALNQNNSACARICGVSRITWLRWRTKPPTWPYWNHILREIIKTVMANMRIQRRGHLDNHKANIQSLYQRIPQGWQLKDQIDEWTYQVSGAQDHLLRLLSNGGMYVDEIRHPVNAGGYSMSALRSAAKRLKIIKDTRGYGDDKRTKWKLPKQHNYTDEMEEDNGKDQ